MTKTNPEQTGPKCPACGNGYIHLVYDEQEKRYVHKCTNCEYYED